MNQTNNNNKIKPRKKTVAHLISFQSYDFKEQHELYAAKKGWTEKTPLDLTTAQMKANK